LKTILAGLPQPASEPKTTQIPVGDSIQILETELESATPDTTVITSLQTTEQHEIGCYSSAFSLAKLLSRRADADLLRQSLNEETAMNERLYSLAQTLGIERFECGRHGRFRKETAAAGPFRGRYFIMKVPMKSGNVLRFHRAR
jgi:hypothetical protein